MGNITNDEFVTYATYSVSGSYAFTKWFAIRLSTTSAESSSTGLTDLLEARDGYGLRRAAVMEYIEGVDTLQAVFSLRANQRTVWPYVGLGFGRVRTREVPFDNRAEVEVEKSATSFLLGLQWQLRQSLGLTLEIHNFWFAKEGCDRREFGEADGGECHWLPRLDEFSLSNDAAHFYGLAHGMSIPVELSLGLSWSFGS